MKLKRIELCNFCQFYGKQEVLFADADTIDFPTIAVIYGRNSQGLFELYRALLFGLYGKRVLGQERRHHRKKTEKESYLVNRVALYEDKQGERNGVIAYVAVDFSYQNQEYKIYRALSGIQRDDGTIAEQMEDIRLTVTAGDRVVRRWGLLEESKISREINNILDYRVAKHFFLDNAKMQKLTEVALRRTVEEEIKSLLAIDEFYLTEEAMGKLDTKLLDEISKLEIRGYKRKLAERQAVQARIQELRKKQHDVESQTTDAYYQQTLQKLRQFLPDAILLLARDVLAEVYQDIDERREKGQVPYEIKTELVERLLLEMACICGRPVTLNSVEHKHLQQWLEFSGENVSVDEIRLFKCVNQVLQFLTGKNEIFIELMNDVVKMDEYAKLPKATNLTDFNSLNEKREQIAADLRAAEIQFKEIDATVNKLQEQYALYAEMLEKRQIVAKAHEAVTRIIEVLLNEVIVDLEREANLHFTNMIASQKLPGKIVVTNDFALEVYGGRKKTIFSDISFEQKKIVALAFLIAFAQVAGGSQVLKGPLFMDWLFEGITNKQLEGILKYIPQIAPQWILTITDFDLAADIADHLRNTALNTKFYMLETAKEGTILIKKTSAVPHTECFARGANDCYE